MFRLKACSPTQSSSCTGTALPDNARSTANYRAHLLRLLLVDSKQGPQVQQGVCRWGGLPLLSSHCNVFHGAVMNVTLQALLVADTSHLHNVHLVPAMLQISDCHQSMSSMYVLCNSCSTQQTRHNPKYMYHNPKYMYHSWCLPQESPQALSACANNVHAHMQCNLTHKIDAGCKRFLIC